jgi:hypothetical protein
MALLLDVAIYDKDARVSIIQPHKIPGSWLEMWRQPGGLNPCLYHQNAPGAPAVGVSLASPPANHDVFSGRQGLQEKAGRCPCISFSVGSFISQNMFLKTLTI